MDEINISEQKPKHKKTFLGIGIVILILIIFGGLSLFQKTKIQEVGGSIKTVLTKPISLKERDRSSFPPHIINFVGAWEGSWNFGLGKNVPVALTVTDVVPDKGVNVWYGIEENTELGISGTAKNVLGEVGMLREKEGVIALVFAFSQFENTAPAQFHFWFTDPTSKTLLGEFIHPKTGEVIQGTFSVVE